MSRIFALILCALFVGRAFAFETTARNAYLIDTSTGTVMFSKDSDVAAPPASMSKLMTIALLFKALKEGKVTMDTVFPVSEKAWAMGGSKMFVENGSQVRVEDLIQGIIVQSGNDACVVVAEGLAGSEEQFAQLMNSYAKEIGLTHSSFGNASGWPDPRQRMSAHDLAVLAYYLQQNYPEYWHYFSEKEFTYNGITQPNRNPILGVVQGANGLKTGHTEEAGYGLVGSVERNDRSVIFVLMGMQSEAERATEAENIATWALSNFTTKTYFDNDETIVTVDTWLADKPTVGLAASEGLTTLEPIAGAANVKVTANYYEPISAPLDAGTEVGTITISSDSFDDYTLPLVTTEALERGGFVRRFTDVSTSLAERLRPEAN